MGKKDGSEMFLFYSTTLIDTATSAAIKAMGTWVEAVDVATVEQGNARANSDFNARSGVITSTGPAKLTLTITVAYDTDDAFVTACKAAYNSNSEIALADVDGPVTTAGTKGEVSNHKITGFNKSEPDSGPTVYTIEAAASGFTVLDYDAPA